MGKKKRNAARLARVVNGARVELVAAVSAIVVDGDPTPFVFEGALRHGIRAGLLLSATGWTWKAADATAMEIIGEALRKAGAKRPTWPQGQPEYTVWRTSDGLCIRCRQELPEDGLERFYCSPICRAAHLASRARAIKGAEGVVARRAEYHAAMAAAPWERCPVCGTAMQRSPRSQAVKAGRRPVCSPSCRGKLAAEARREKAGDFVI